MGRVIAIVTLYQPNDENISNLALILEQVDYLVICDNSLSDNHIRVKNVLQNPHYSYLYNSKNLGLSAAFNIALNMLELNWSDNDYVIFFDQDSKIDKNYIIALKSEYEKLISLDYKIGCIGPKYYDKSAECYCVPKIKKDITDTLMSVKSIITSSMLCRYGELKEIGFWNEDIFLDMADWDLCWRFQQNGYLTCMTTKVCLMHKLGDNCKKIGPLTLKTSNPIREYYQTRDSLKLLHKSYTPFKFKIRFIKNLTLKPVVHFLLLDDKKKRLSYFYRGIKDYYNGVSGEITK